MIKKKSIKEKKVEPKTLPIKIKVKRDYIYAVGRRKTSVARVRLYNNGEGDITINNKKYDQYFPYFEWKEIVTSPLNATGMMKNFNFTIRVKGGGIKSQAGAVRSGITRALLKINANLRKTLKPLGYITIDSRQKERKKPGLKRARRAPQWQKR